MIRRILGFGVGFGVVVLAAWLLVRPAVSARARVLAESSGALKTVEIHFRKDAPEPWPALAAFFGAIAPSVQVLAMCPSAGDATALRAKWRWPNKLTTVVMGRDITPWSKDRFLVGAESPARLLCPKPEPTAMAARNNDAAVAAKIASFAPKRFVAQNTSLIFDAGDILCDDQRAIFGDELVRKNPGVADLATRVAEITGRRAFVLRGVPGHHIGMFAAPLGPGVTAVGDVDLGRKLGAHNGLATPDFSEPTLALFRTAVKKFAQSGDRLVRLPLVPIEPKVFITYTNGVFENRDGHRIVYMPWYGVRSLDEAARNAYVRAGWEVRPIPVRTVFRYRGTIGCLVNVLERQGR